MVNHQSRNKQLPLAESLSSVESDSLRSEVDLIRDKLNRNLFLLEPSQQDLKTALRDNTDLCDLTELLSDQLM